MDAERGRPRVVLPARPKSTRPVAMPLADRKRIGIGKDDHISDDLSALGGQPAPPPGATCAVFDTFCHAVFKLFTMRQSPLVRCHRSR